MPLKFPSNTNYEWGLVFLDDVRNTRLCDSNSATGFRKVHFVLAWCTHKSHCVVKNDNIRFKNWCFVVYVWQLLNPHRFCVAYKIHEFILKLMYKCWEIRFHFTVCILLVNERATLVYLSISLSVRPNSICYSDNWLTIVQAEWLLLHSLLYYGWFIELETLGPVYWQENELI